MQEFIRPFYYILDAEPDLFYPFHETVATKDPEKSLYANELKVGEDQSITFQKPLSTPVTASIATNWYLEKLPIFNRSLHPVGKGYRIGITHGYFLLGPFYIFGPLRNSENALLAGLESEIALIVILTIALNIYGIARFSNPKRNPSEFTYDEQTDSYIEYKNWFDCRGLESFRSCKKFALGFFIGALEGSLIAAYILFTI